MRRTILLRGSAGDEQLCTAYTVYTTTALDDEDLQAAVDVVMDALLSERVDDATEMLHKLGVGALHVVAILAIAARFDR